MSSRGGKNKNDKKSRDVDKAKRANDKRLKETAIARARRTKEEEQAHILTKSLDASAGITHESNRPVFTHKRNRRGGRLTWQQRFERKVAAQMQEKALKKERKKRGVRLMPGQVLLKLDAPQGAPVGGFARGIVERRAEMKEQK